VTSLEVVLLDEGHDVSEFQSDAAELDVWLKGHASTAQQRDTARVYVAVGDDRVVRGYMAMTVGVVASRRFPSRAGRGLPEDIPAVLLAKLAVDQRYQRKGISISLLSRALRVSLDVRRLAAARVLLVQARDTAYRSAGVVRKMGFKRLREEKVLYVRLKDLET
jgi:GNAT superfamily N-acetyltransferase